MDRGISPKFGLRIDFDLPNLAKSPKTKPEVELRCHGGYLENGYDVIPRLQMASLDKIW